MPRQRLTRPFFRTDSITLARKLLGTRLVRVLDDGSRLTGIIVETEAYLGVPDRAAHSYNGRRTPRTEPMYADAGIAYVYFTYGMHFCFNIVAGRINHPIAVLIRALEPTESLDQMRTHRAAGATASVLGSSRVPRPAQSAVANPPGATASTLRRAATPILPDTLLCAGPARLCQALAIDRDLNAIDLTTSPHLFLERDRRILPRAISSGPRIGVESAREWAQKPLRFWITGNPHVSR
jgi:DNA-3-methyladenine glycosylase